METELTTDLTALKAAETVERPPQQPTLVRSSGITIAHLLLLGGLALGGIMRFGGLAALPLSMQEAAEALAAINFWQPDVTPDIGSPAYFTLTALLKPLIGQSDAAVRLIPTLFGMATLFLPWLLRDKIGTIGALSASLFLALSPTQAALSRSAGGDSIAIFCTLLLFIIAVQLVEDGAAQGLTVGAVALGLGFASSPLFYTGLVAFGLTFLTSFLNQRPENYAILQKSGLVVVGTFVGISTMALWEPGGFGAAASLVADWFGRFQLQSTFINPLTGLIRYETGLLVFGMIAIASALRQLDGFRRTLLTWLALSLLVALLQAGHLSNLGLVVVPLSLLIGLWLHESFSYLGTKRIWLVASLVGIWGLIALVNIGRYVRLAGTTINPLLTIILVLLLMSSATVFLVNDLRDTVQGFTIGLLFVALFFSWGTAWALTHTTGNHPREIWTDVGTDSDIRLLQSTLEEGSYQLARSNREISIVSTIDTPVMRWYLRNFEDITFAQTIPASVDAEAVINSAENRPAIADRFAESQFDYLQTGVSTPELGVNAVNQLRWFFFRDNILPVEKERVSLWLNLANE